MKKLNLPAIALGLFGALIQAIQATDVPRLDNIQDYAVESRIIRGKQPSSRLYLMWISNPASGISHMTVQTNGGIVWNLQFDHGSQWYQVGEASFLCMDRTNRYVPDAYIISFGKGNSPFDSEWNEMNIKDVSSLLIGNAYRSNNTDPHHILSVEFHISYANEGQPAIQLRDKYDQSKIYQKIALSTLLKESEKLKDSRTIPGTAGINLHQEKPDALEKK
ncbi:hypothetical protein [Akkermansia glycaniphila]|uniref:Uncharacterized protein n=1 Tax=Akkermansia glycaniphila TaxID=1679444 RepID=A0A1H6MGH6_9BACT|nr:hypothetical protein [Akkermansia glycaniphila]SEH97412.1 Hypothetical protein PYTT_2212 [Akkermansia glycaniphila]